MNIFYSEIYYCFHCLVKHFCLSPIESTMPIYRVYCVILNNTKFKFSINGTELEHFAFFLLRLCTRAYVCLVNRGRNRAEIGTTLFVTYWAEFLNLGVLDAKFEHPEFGNPERNIFFLILFTWNVQSQNFGPILTRFLPTGVYI